MLTLTAATSPLTFANALRVGQAFTTHSALCAKTGLAGLGRYVPFDNSELDELRDSPYVIYSYDTPIAWRTRGGGWVKNMQYYSVTTSKHQNKIFAAINELS